ncbi:hypothetical protein HK104_008897, partial [Borealophlyctis nickersoniae]
MTEPSFAANMSSQDKCECEMEYGLSDCVLAMEGFLDEVEGLKEGGDANNGCRKQLYVLAARMLGFFGTRRRLPPHIAAGIVEGYGEIL